MLSVQQTSLRQVQSGRCKEPGSGRNSEQSCHASPRWPAPRLPVARDILTLLVWPLQQNFSNVKLNPKLVASQTLEKWWDFKQAEVEGKISEHSRTGACVGHVLRKQGQVQRRGWERQTDPGAEPRSLWTSFRKQRGIAGKGAALSREADARSSAPNTRRLVNRLGGWWGAWSKSGWSASF